MHSPVGEISLKNDRMCDAMKAFNLLMKCIRFKITELCVHQQCARHNGKEVVEFNKRKADIIEIIDGKGSQA
jgi:hypothetical protein